MYFVKTSDTYQRFSFTDENINLVFKVVATEENKGNQKQKDLYFDIDNIEKINDEFAVNFKRISSNEEIDSLGKNKTERQKILNQNISKTIREKTGIKINILKNLEKFQRRYTEDYFIHKNLREFLEKQLIFFINQELLNIDAIFTKNGIIREDKNILSIVFRDVALNIIEKLSLLENLKKKIWEKKKFVLESNYVITLDKIEEYCGAEFLERIIPEILVNSKQLSEWKDLFGIIITSKNDLLVKDPQQKLTTNKDIEWKKLPLDTNHFPIEFKWKLISKIANLDGRLNGILIHSENWQALNLIQRKYNGKIKCVYIDPPYNTGSDEFKYFDKYNQNSWMSMIFNRLNYAYEFLTNSGVFYCSIDDNEFEYLHILFNSIFGKENVDVMVWKKSGYGRDGKMKNTTTFRKDHEYVLTSFKNDNILNKIREKPNFQNKYPNLDKDPRGPYKAGSISRAEYASNTDSKNYFSVVSPSGKTFTRQWDITKEAFEILTEDVLLNEDGRLVSRIYWGKNDDSVPSIKIFVNEEREITPYSVLLTKGTTTEGTSELNNFINNEELAKKIRPKPTLLIKTLVQLGTNADDFIIDFFAGSGTTAESILRLNKDETSHRKYILVDFGQYFNDILVLRIKKLLFSLSWRSGKPKEMDSIGGFFKYQELEQYEDALENIQFKQLRLDSFENYGKLLQYYLEDGIDAERSKNFLGVDTEKEFLDLKIKVLNKDGTTRDQNIDLIETFNYLIGIEVQQMKKLSNGGMDYYIVTGVVKDNSTIIIWRDPKVNKEKDKEFINKLLQEKSYKEIYVNSDCLIKNYKNIYDEMRKRLW